jgi:hypothetical protein
VLDDLSIVICAQGKLEKHPVNITTHLYHLCDPQLYPGTSSGAGDELGLHDLCGWGYCREPLNTTIVLLAILDSLDNANWKRSLSGT